MSDVDLIASADSPFPEWVRDAVRDLRDERDALRGQIRERVLAGICAARVEVTGDALLYAADDGTMPIYDADDREAQLLTDAVVRALAEGVS